MTAASPVEPCGGCGNADPAKVCIGCLHFATPPASPAEPTERERLYEIAKAGGNWYAAAKPIPDEAFDALATPPASPAATDEEVAEWRVGYWHWGGADIYVMDPSSTSTINGEGVRYIAKGLPTFDMAEAIVKEHNAAADLFARVARERDEARDRLAVELGNPSVHEALRETTEQLAAAEKERDEARAMLNIISGMSPRFYSVEQAAELARAHLAKHGGSNG